MESEYKEREAIIKEKKKVPIHFLLVLLSGRRVQLSRGERLICILTGTQGPVDHVSINFPEWADHV